MADYDVVVLGSGPGGYVAAIRAGQLGMKTAVVERDALGGICLNWGCIPSKALLRNAEVLSLIQHADEFGITIQGIKPDFSKAVDRSRQVVGRLTRGVGMLLRKNGVQHHQGTGVLVDANTVRVDGDRALSADNIIVATGARQRHIPSLPIDGETVITSREALELRRVPRRVVIIGGGATGCEFAYVGGHMAPKSQLSSCCQGSFRTKTKRSAVSSSDRSSVKAFNCNCAQVQGIAVDGGTAKVSVLSNDGSTVMEGDKVLVAVGVQGNVDGSDWRLLAST